MIARFDDAGRALVCLECGEPLPDPRGKVGQPRKTCSAECLRARQLERKRLRYAAAHRPHPSDLSGPTTDGGIW